LAVADRKLEPIGLRIADYVKTLTGSSEHRGHTERYLRRLAKDCHWACLADMRRDQLELWLSGQSDPGADGRPIRSARSRNAHHTAVVSFCNWCAHPDNGRLARNPCAKLAKADVDLVRRKVRRSLTANEVDRIIAAACNAPQRPPVKAGDCKARMASDPPNGSRPRPGPSYGRSWLARDCGSMRRAV
jgi:hypothetical protein